MFFRWFVYFCFNIVSLSIAGVSATTANGRDGVRVIAGGTAGVSSQPYNRFGPDISVLAVKCVDSCGGWGVSAGIINPVSGEYFVGAAGGGAYFSTVWIDAAVRIKKEKISGFHMTYAMGLYLMPYLGVGYDRIENRPFGELGFTFKWPVTN